MDFTNQQRKEVINILFGGKPTYAYYGLDLNSQDEELGLKQQTSVLYERGIKLLSNILINNRKSIINQTRVPGDPGCIESYVSSGPGIRIRRAEKVPVILDVGGRSAILESADDGKADSYRTRVDFSRNRFFVSDVNKRERVENLNLNCYMYIA